MPHSATWWTEQVLHKGNGNHFLGRTWSVYLIVCHEIIKKKKQTPKALSEIKYTLVNTVIPSICAHVVGAADLTDFLLRYSSQDGVEL